jgi:hypothetical protein
MRSMKLFLIALTCLTGSSALAEIQCRITYSVDDSQKETSLLRRVNPVPATGGRSLVFRPDGVVRAATATFQQAPNVPPQQILGTLSLVLQLDNGNNQANAETEYMAQHANYRGDRVTLQIVRPAGSRNFGFPVPGQPAQVVPLTFKGPGDFSAQSVGNLKDKVITKIDLDCANNLP